MHNIQLNLYGSTSYSKDSEVFKSQLNVLRALMAAFNWNNPALDDANCTIVGKAAVTIYRPSGKYYTHDHWDIPVGAIGPYDMENSRDYKTWREYHKDWIVVVEAQEPWGFPFVLTESE